MKNSLPNNICFSKTIHLKRMLFVITLGLLISSQLSLAQLGTDEFTIAEDDASNYSTWNTGDNEGSGFGNWNFSTSGSNSGNYIGGTGQGDPSFGINANSGNSITAARPLSNSLKEGDKISVDIGATNVNTGAELLVQLVDGTTIVFTLKFVGGNSDWIVNDGGSDFSSGESFATNDSKNFTFTYEGGNDYSYTLGTNGSGSNFTATSTINNIDEIRFVNNGQGSGENFGFNNLEITSKYTIPNGESSDVTSDTTVPFLDIQSGGSVEVQNGNNWTLTVEDGGTFTNNGTFTANDGKVIFQGNNVISSSSGTIFNNVTLNNNGVDFGTNSTINGNLTINSGGFVDTNSPIYGNDSTLIYNTASLVTNPYQRRSEWSNAGNQGSPYNVVVQNNTAIDMGADNTTDNAVIDGDLTINSDSSVFLDFDSNDMTAPLIVKGNFINNGTISLSDQPGGDLKVEGNLTDNGTFNYKGRALFLEGSTDQSITTSADPYTIDVLRINKSNGEVIMNQDIIIDETGDPLEMSLQSILNLNNNTLTIDQNGVANSQINFSDNSALKVSDQSDLILKGNGSMGDLKFDDSNDRTTNKIRYIEVDKGSGDVNLGNQLYLKDSINLTSGTLNSGGNLTFVSNNSKTAQVGEVPSSGGSISGDVIVERFVPKSNRAFRYISSPVNTSGTINFNLQEDATTASADPDPKPGFGTHITGGSTSLGFDATSTNNASMFEWDESSTPPDWVAVSSTNDINNDKMSVGDAYALMVRGDRSTPLNSNTVVGDPTTLRFTGTLVGGNHAVAATNLSSTSGNYNLVANPYQAIVDMKTLMESTDATDLDNQTIYVYDPTLGTQGGYATIDLSLGNPTSTPDGTNADENILPNQAFFVETVDTNSDNNINPSLTFKETYKNTAANFVDTFSDDDVLSEMHINLKRQPEDVLVDGVTARFDLNHTNAVNNADADEVWNFDEWVALFNSDNYLSIEKRATPVENDSLQIYIGNYQSDSYVWQIDISNINREAVLVDNYLDTETPLNANDETSIAFDIDSNIPESIDPFRFSVRFTDETLAVDDPGKTNFAVYPNPVTNSRFTVSGLQNSGNASVQLFDISGKLVFTTTKSAENTMTIDIDRSLPTGVYQLHITQDQTHYQSTLIISE